MVDIPEVLESRPVPDSMQSVGESHDAAPATAGDRPKDLKAKIVLAGDNADLQDHMRQLQSADYEVIAVADGEEALRAVVEHKPDLVLTYVMMPNLDGLGLLKALREDARTASIPIIMLSAGAGEESCLEGLDAGADDYLIKPFSARELLARVGAQIALSRLRNEALERERLLRAEAEIINAVTRDLSSELDLQVLLQKATDAATKLTRAQFGAFFYNMINEQGEAFLLYTLSGAPREAFEKFGAPRNLAIFDPTFRGEGVVRLDDVRKDPRYGHNAPHHGMPKGPLPVCSYLAVPVTLRSGEVVGGLFFGHPEPSVFTEHAERVAVNIATQAAIAIDNARLYSQIKKELRERVAVEQSLRESEERFAKAFEASPLAMTISSLKTGKLMEVNETFVALSGYTSEEVIGRSAIELGLWVNPQEHAEGREIIQESGQVHNSEHRFRTRNGAEVTGLVSAERLEIGGEPCVLTVIQDITERKRAEHAQTLLASIVESSDDAIVSKDLNGIIMSWNRGAERLFGYAAEELIGLPITVIIPPEKHGEEHTILERIRSGEQIEHYETIRVAKDGQPIDISLSVSPVRDRTGRIVGASKIARDISDRKRAEKERAQLLAREQAARAQAEEANRLKDEFLATVSHELRTPLNGILGWVNLLRTGKLDNSTTTSALETIERNARSQNRLIEDLLDVSRIISGKMRLDVRQVTPVAVIEAALETIRPTAEAKGVRLQTILDPLAGPVSGDANRLQQVVWNLLSNAVKFTPCDGRVMVQLQRINSYVEIIVSDTGSGIDREFLPYVFDRFRQADGSTTRSQGGLGLGLAIVRHLVELHGGSVHVNSEGKDQGTTFTVELPLTATLNEPQQPEGVHPTVSNILTVDCGIRLDGIRVLAVDDEADARTLLTALLGGAGAEVVVAMSSEEGLRLLASGRFDVIISDIEMPGEDGYTFIRKVRKLEAGRQEQTPAIALTAYARAEDRVRALTSGYKTHVSKPVEPIELIALITSLIGRAIKEFDA